MELEVEKLPGLVGICMEELEDIAVLEGVALESEDTGIVKELKVEESKVEERREDCREDCRVDEVIFGVEEIMT